MSPPVDRPWRPKARDFAQFQAAIEEELRSKPDDSEWVVELEVKKRGNPIHDYRIVLRPR